MSQTACAFSLRRATLSLASMVVVLIMIIASTATAFSATEGFVDKSLLRQRPDPNVLRERLVGANIHFDGDAASNMDENSSQTEGRHLQDTTSRACDEVIGVASKDAVAALMTGLVDILVPPPTTATPDEVPDNNALFKQLIMASAQYDIVATKICSSCAEVMDMFEGDMFNNDDEAPNSFSSYCGVDRNKHETVVSGLLFQPYDIATDTYIPGVFKGAITGKQTNSSSFYAATERWPQDAFLSLPTTAFLILRNADILVPAFAASTGTVSLIADYVGYGEDFAGTKSYGTKRDYQLSTVPLWMSAMKSIPEKTGGCASLQSTVSVFGYSEGAYNAVAVAAALHDLGVNVLSVFGGGGPYRPATTAKTVIAGIENGTFNRNFLAAVALVGHSFSSTNPEKANTDQGQDVLAGEWRDLFVGYIDDGLTLEEVNAKFDPINPLKHLDERLVNASLTANDEGFFDACTPEFAEKHPDLYLDKLCEAFQENDLTEILEKSPYPVTLCHSPQDEVSDFNNLPNVTANPNLAMFDVFPVLGDHTTAYAICNLAVVLQYGTRPDLKGVEASEVGVCPSAFVDTCMEDAKTEIAVPRATGTKVIGCSNLAEISDEEVSRYYCQKKKKAARLCAATCGTCEGDDCSDDLVKTFKEFDTSTSKTCKWLSNKENDASVERLCAFSGTRSACPITCGDCAN